MLVMNMSLSDAPGTTSWELTSSVLYGDLSISVGSLGNSSISSQLPSSWMDLQIPESGPAIDPSFCGPSGTLLRPWSMQRPHAGRTLGSLLCKRLPLACQTGGTFSHQFSTRSSVTLSSFSPRSKIAPRMLCSRCQNVNTASSSFWEQLRQSVHAVHTHVSRGDLHRLCIPHSLYFRPSYIMVALVDKDHK